MYIQYNQIKIKIGGGFMAHKPNKSKYFWLLWCT